MAILLSISFILFLLYSCLIIYYTIGWVTIPLFNPNLKEQIFSTHISVIIPARNEAQNLPVLLQSLLAQTYPVHLFEVMVVDDHSTDSTSAILHNYTRFNIRKISLAEYDGLEKINSYKKKAIEIAIKESKGTLMVTTDADCYLPQNWLATIAAFYEKEQPVFIAAPVVINNAVSFIEIFQALDFMTLQGITGAAVYKKMSSMCNGANMAYEKNVFYEVDGFKNIDSIASGDDMLLMHKIYKRYPNKVLYLKSANAMADTQPVKSIAQFFNQRIRWASKADKYDDKRILPILILVYVFNLLLFIIPVASIFYPSHFNVFSVTFSSFQYWLLLLGLKTLVELIFLIPVAIFFKKIWLLILFPLMQPFHIIYCIIAGWLGKFGSYQWKGRKLN
ncbi:MAG: glycosyltransferase [Bacteroidetes bacterium]|nr:glycosyltransferase [Bacteroidota bacterium]MBS1757644.1 glycosyltransferase [Bacteroidota bacterium]